MRILVPTIERYAYILPDFTRAFLRAWPDCPWPVHILRADADPAEIVNPLPANWQAWAKIDEGWAANLLSFVAGSAEPFLLLLEDYILDCVDPALLQRAATIMEHDQRVGMIRVHPCPGPTLPWPDQDPPGAFGLIDKRQPYATSLQPAIWRPEVCRDLFRYDEDPWQTEIWGSRRAQEYDRYAFLGTIESACGYRGLLARGREVESTREWIRANL